MEKIKFAYLNESAFPPTRKHFTDAGIDLYACISEEYIEIYPEEVEVIHTGLTVEISENHFGLITNKSKNNFIVGAGVVDHGYQGELLVKIINNTNDIIYIHHGDAIAQILIIPCKILDIEIANLSEIHQNESERGKDGGIARQVSALGDETAEWYQKEFENLREY